MSDVFKYLNFIALTPIIAALAYYLAPEFNLSPTYWQAMIVVGFSKVFAVYLGLGEIDVDVTIVDERNSTKEDE